jgi:hypothetical protein
MICYVDNLTFSYVDDVRTSHETLVSTVVTVTVLYFLYFFTFTLCHRVFVATMKKEPARSSFALLTAYKTTQNHGTQYRNPKMDLHCLQKS